MRRRAWVLAILVAVLCTAGTKPREGTDLAYRFTLEPEPEPKVRVELVLAGTDSGVTWLEVSREWGGVDAGGEDLTNAAAWGPNRESLTVAHPEPHRWRVQHTPGAELHFTYDIRRNAHQDDAGPSTNRRPLVNEHLFHCYGDLGIMRPAGVDESLSRAMAITWDGFEAAGRQVACSFGVGARPITFRATLQELRNSVWMAGDLELLRRDLRGRPLWIAVQRAAWTFAPANFADLAQAIVGMEREFFGDFEYPFYLVTLIPVGKAEAGNRSLGGTGLTNSFSLCMLPDTPLGGDYGAGMHVAGLLAHEMFHQWNGQTIEPMQPEQLCYWFTEGFTDFYARRLLYRNGLISLDEFARSVSQRLADLWMSEVRNSPNTRIETDFWKHDGVKRLPYLRGDVVAMIVDDGIRMHSTGKWSLDDVMRQLVRDTRSHGEKVTTESLIAAIATYAGAEVAAQVRAIVVDGATPALAPDTFAPCLEVRERDVVPYELGFDFGGSRTEGRVVGLVPGSAADRAGLRDGQKLVAWSVAAGNVAQAVVLTLVEDGVRRNIRYEPKGAALRAPGVFQRAGEAAGKCAGL